MTFDEYMQQPNARRIILAEVTSGNTVYYFSDDMYITEPTDSIANIPYTPLISGSGLPSYRTSLDSPLAPRASASTGSMTLADEMCMSTVSGGSPLLRSIVDVKRGATVVFKIAAPRNLFAYSTAIVLFTARIRSIGGSDDGSIEIVTTAPSRRLFDSFTLTDRGVYGRVSNIPLQLIDFANRTYATTSNQPIQAVTAVYDGAVLLTAGSGYTTNLTTGVITLVNPPVDTVTADIDGFKSGATWLESTRQITEYLVSPYLSAGTYGIITDRIGYFHEEKELISDILDKLALSAGAFWFVDDMGLLRFKEWKKANPVATVAFDFTEMRRYEFTAAEELYESIEIGYQKNWTIQTPRAGAATARANYVVTKGPVIITSGITDGSEATPAEPIDGFWQTQESAEVVSERILEFLGVARFIYSTEVPIMQALELGDTIQIDTITGSKRGILISRELIFDGGVPMQAIEIVV